MDRSKREKVSLERGALKASDLMVTYSDLTTNQVKDFLAWLFCGECSSEEDHQIVRSIEENCSITELAVKLGVSRPTASKRKARLIERLQRKANSELQG